MNKTNERIRQALKECGVRQWELADYLKVSVPTLTRMMRHELPENEQDRIISVIRNGGAK